MQPSPFGEKPAGLRSREESDRIKKSRADAMADGVMSAIRGAVKAVTTDLPGFVLDIADKISGSTKTLGENDRSEQMFSAITGTKKQDEVAELVGGFVNPVTAVKAMIVPAVLGENLGRAQKLTKAGMSPATVFKETGLYREPRAQLFKQPIADNKAELNLVNLISWQPVPLEDVLVHPTLYGKLPELQKTTISYNPNELGAAFNPSLNHIRVGKILDRSWEGSDAASLILHEAQHAVQKFGKFGKGNLGTSQEAEMAKNIYSSWEEAWKAYLANPGEVEARFTELTRNLNQQQLNNEVLKLLMEGKTPSGKFY